MSKKINYIITDSNITVNYDGQTHIVSRSDALSNKLIEALRNQKLDEIPSLVSAAKRIEKFSRGKFTVQDGIVFIDGNPAPTVLGNKIVKFSKEGLPFQPLVKFAENLQANPSYRAVNELFQFLEKNDHPITENGNFIAYKKVRPDFMDIHSGTFNNAPGVVVEVPRNQVDEDSSQTCSHGLHVANWDYAKNRYGSSDDIMLEVEVNPADVVAIPSDYNQSKMRVCRYTVLEVVDKEHSSDTSYRIVNNEVASSYQNDLDEECDDVDCGCHEDEEDEILVSYEDEEDDYPWDDELE